MDQLAFHSVSNRQCAVLLVKLMSEWWPSTYRSSSAWLGQLLPEPVSVTSKPCTFVLFGLCFPSKSQNHMPVGGYNNLSHKVTGEKQLSCWSPCSVWSPTTSIRIWAVLWLLGTVFQDMLCRLNILACCQGNTQDRIKAFRPVEVRMGSSMCYIQAALWLSIVIRLKKVYLLPTCF